MSESTLWFENNDKRAADRAFEYAASLEQARRPVIDEAARHYQLYDGRGNLEGDRMSPLREKDDWVSENVMKSVIDTGGSLVIHNTPRPAFQTDQASFSVQRRAKQLELYVEGLFQIAKVYQLARLSFRDGELADGFIKVSPDPRLKRPRFDRLLIDEVLVDEWQSRDGMPPDAMHRIFADRRKLAAQFKHEKNGKQLAAAIMAAPEPEDLPMSAGRHPARSQMVKVLHCWRVPSEPGADDGVEAVFMRAGEGNHNKTLYWGPWKRPEIPIVRISWTPPTMGYYGTPLAKEIAGNQLRIHYFNSRITEIVDRLAYPMVACDQADLEAALRWRPEEGMIIPTLDGKGVTVEANRVIPPDLFTERQRLNDLSFRLTGIGDYAAFAKKPADIRSGPGIREHNDTQSQRFIGPHMAFEQLILDLARHALEVSKEMYEDREVDPEVMWRSRDRAKRIKWSEVGKDFDHYVMHVAAASILSRTPAARRDMALDLFNAGIIDGVKTLKLIDIPDLHAEADRELADEHDVDSVIEKLEDGVMVVPDPFSTHEMHFERIRKNYHRIRHLSDENPESLEAALQAHRKHLNLLMDILKKKAEAQMQIAAATQGGAPPAQALPAEQPLPAVG